MTGLEIALALYSTATSVVIGRALQLKSKGTPRFTTEECSVIAHTMANQVSSRKSLVGHTPHTGPVIDAAVASLLAQEILVSSYEKGDPEVRYRITEGSEICAMRE